MIFLKQKDIFNINTYNKVELANNINKFLFIHLLNSKFYNKNQKSKFFRAFILNNLKYKAKKSKIILRCKSTNRGRGIFRPYNISRGVLREMIHSGLVPGFKKAVW